MKTPQPTRISRDAYGALLLMLAAPALIPGIGMMAAPLAGLDAGELEALVRKEGGFLWGLRKVFQG